MMKGYLWHTADLFGPHVLVNGRVHFPHGEADHSKDLPYFFLRVLGRSHLNEVAPVAMVGSHNDTSCHTDWH